MDDLLLGLSILSEMIKRTRVLVNRGPLDAPIKMIVKIGSVDDIRRAHLVERWDRVDHHVGVVSRVRGRPKQGILMGYPEIHKRKIIFKILNVKKFLTGMRKTKIKRNRK